MTAEPVMEPAKAMDPVDLLIAVEDASEEAIRPEYIEGMVIVPPHPDYQHNDAALSLVIHLREAGFRHSGIGTGFRAALGTTTQSLVVPDFFVLHRRPSEVDEAYRKAHRGWYSADLLALVGEVTSSNHEVDSGPKYRAYAAAGVPVHVLIHRKEGKAYAFSDPVSHEGDPRYKTTSEVKLGNPLPLPSPYPALDTSAPLRG
ncbi:Uma2 family endonuclease [Streptomyces sp. RK75]|uniref:Uma2 family endonuclease n=1 Tax=Streptomyces sp. RK75 TaxID=2824895 RepID=UPI001B39177E|nr:Uma2 family endonuclease [Streptomyces sp. RK75]MBQ0867264.1 Uma2 family endonuclease [Streptomyces sp. RK75]